MSTLEQIIDQYEDDEAKEFQCKTVKDIAYKFYVQEKQKIVLADEVGMGKTYVAKGIVKIAPKLMKKEKVTAFYISPNLKVARQNIEELSRGLIPNRNLETMTKRLSLHLSDDAQPLSPFALYSFTSGMFFNVNAVNAGTQEEREHICRILRGVFGNIGSLIKEYPEAATIEQYKDCLESIISAFFRPTGYGSREHKYIDRNVDQAVLDRLAKDFEDWNQRCNVPITLDTQTCMNIAKAIMEDVYLKEHLFILSRCHNELSRMNIAVGKHIIAAAYKNNGFDPKAFPKDIQGMDFFMSITMPYYNEYKFNLHIKYLFTKLRHIMNMAAFKTLSPDLIILDEFHKYLMVEQKEALEQYLQSNQETKVLLVSATPYRMSLSFFYRNGSDEDDEGNKSIENESNEADCGQHSIFGNYVEVYKYVANPQQNELKVRALQQSLEDMKKNLKKLQHAESQRLFDQAWEYCKKNKNRIEAILQEYVVRTERYMAYDINRDVHEESLDRFLDLSLDVIKDEAEMYHTFCKEDNADKVMLYNKFAPYFMSFAKGYKSIGYVYEEADEDNKEGQHKLAGISCNMSTMFWDGKKEPNHLRYQALKKQVIPSDAIKKALWITPSLPYYKLGGFWKDISDYTKTLMFARHVISTKSVAALLTVAAQCQEVEALLPDHVFDELLYDEPYTRECSELAIRYEEGKELTGIFQESMEKYRDKEKALAAISAPIVCFYRIVKDYGEAKRLHSVFCGYLRRNKANLIAAGVRDKESLLAYCAEGCLQAVLDEYAFVTKSVPKFIENLKSALLDSRSTIKYFSQYDIQDNIFNNLSEVTCGFAERFTDDVSDSNSHDKDHFEHLSEAFNSPFLPFVLATTQVAQEGLNLHYYAHRIVHWRLPISPADFEQREGRVNRFRSHLVRKRAAEYIRRNNKEFKDWTDCFDHMLDKDHFEIIPNWYISNSNSDIKMHRLILNHPYSKDEHMHLLLKELIKSYRISLGYGVPIEELQAIQNSAYAKNKGDEMNFKDILINLSPAFKS